MWCTWRSASRPRRRPPTALAAARAALGGRIAYTRVARHRLAARAHRPPLRRALRHRRRSGAGDRHHRLVGRLHAGVPRLFEPGDRVALANPGYPPYRHILKALGCEPVLIETSAATRWALDPDALLAAHRARPLAGVLVASPANPTGTMMTGEALGGADRRGRGRRHPLHLRRDLPRPRLCVSGGDGGAAVRARRDHQLVLEVLLHDRLAHRLDGGAGAAGAADRAAAAEPRDLGADAVAGRGRGRVRRARRDGGGQARLRGEPPHPGRGPAGRRARAFPPRRRRVLSLRRRLALHQRQPRFRQAHAGGGARRGDARASISIRSTATSSSASATPARARTRAPRSSGWGGGCDETMDASCRACGPPVAADHGRCRPAAAEPAASVPSARCGTPRRRASRPSSITT